MFVPPNYLARSSFYFFAPEVVLRKVLIKDEEEVFTYICNECKNRSGVFSVIASRYGDLFLASKKTNDKYILRIVELFNILEKKIQLGKNQIISTLDFHSKSNNNYTKEKNEFIYINKEKDKKISNKGAELLKKLSEKNNI